MAWNENRSEDRVKQNDFGDFEVNVADLSRTMDFRNLSTKDIRRAQGVHIYADVPNFHRAVDDAGNDKTKQKKLIRAASVLRKIQGDILSESDVGVIQRQAARMHALNFKPYDDESKRAERGVVTAITLNSYLYDVFNAVVDDVRDFQGALGLASGTSYIANIGFHGDRELICLGSCANLGAKVINGNGTITITLDIYRLLPESLKECFEKGCLVAGTQTYSAQDLRWSRYPDLAQGLGIHFDVEKLTKKTAEYRDAIPLSEIDLTEANALIELDNLTERNSKRTSAVAIYADLDGFTKYVQEAEEDSKVVSLVRQFHMIRREFHAVIKDDYPGLVLQHQGDRTFAILHLPNGDQSEKRCQLAVDVAIGIQSSMEKILNTRLTDRKDIHVAIGLDAGTVLVTRLGKKGKRAVICLGSRVTSAEILQLRSSGKEIRVSKEIYEALDDTLLTEQFKKNGADYVAKGLTFPLLDELREEKAARSGELGAVVVGDRIQAITSGHEQPRPWGGTKPWISE